VIRGLADPHADCTISTLCFAPYPHRPGTAFGLIRRPAFRTALLRPNRRPPGFGLPQLVCEIVVIFFWRIAGVA
jgi:hypothetical protein